MVDNLIVSNSPEFADKQTKSMGIMLLLFRFDGLY